MNHFKRAWLSVSRRKGKSLILLIVVFILGNLIAGTFAIKQGTSRVETNLKEKLGYNATVALDYEAFDRIDFETLKISESTIQKLGKLPEVAFFDYSLKHDIQSSSLKSYQMPHVRDRSDTEEPTHYFSFQGVEYLDLLDTKTGRIELTSGRTFTEDDLKSDVYPVILSDIVMTENNLRLDEVIDLKTMLPNYGVNEGESTPNINFKIKVVGSFKPVSFNQKADNENWSLVSMYNRIYIPNHRLRTLRAEEAKIAEAHGIDILGNDSIYNEEKYNYRDSVFVMESEADLNAFTQQAKELLEDGLTVRTSQQSFEMIAAPMAMLNVMADYTLKGAAITTTIVLSLVVILFLRDRKHEMGIYIALGDRQWGVLGQVTLEVLMITLMGLTLSFGTGLMLANKVSDVLISDSYMDGVFIDTESSYLPSINMIEVNEDYRIELTPSYVLSVYLLGAGVAVASSILPMFYVTRMKPKKILM